MKEHRRRPPSRQNLPTAHVRDGDRFVFRYGAQSIHGLAPGTFGIFNAQGQPAIVVKCPQCGQESDLHHHSIDNEGRIEREVICPSCTWTAFALIHNWRETWRRIVGQYPGSRIVQAKAERIQ